MAPEIQATPAEEFISVKDFFEKVPPGRRALVRSLATEKYNMQGNMYHPLNLPILELHCDTELRNGTRFFDSANPPDVRRTIETYEFVIFRCRNCGEATKTYAISASLQKHGLNGVVFKFGEVPAFGPPTPARLITLIGPEREYFLKGRRSENQGLGIAAFAYYRRVVESQKNRILDEIIRAATKIGTAKEMLDDLEAAKNETQFSKAVDAVKHGIPQSLQLNGHNPLTLLHSALSEGMHAQTDEECLELATSIRVVLSDLADRLGSALKERAELNDAVSRLLKANAPKPGE